MKIKVPATTANLGPGYDVMGMSLSLYNYFEINSTDEYIDYKDNLVYDSFKYIFDLEKKSVPKVEIKIYGDVPMSRGLGSSATCIIAGLIAANKLLDDKYSEDEILKFATDIEHHPDNVAPALFGGLVISAMEDGEVIYYRLEPSDKLRYSVVVPDFALKTVDARRVVPREFSIEDAIYNVSRSNLVSRAIEYGDFKMLKKASGDKFHENYRADLIPKFKDLKENLEDAAVFISGAGSSILVITEKNVDPRNGIVEILDNSYNYDILNLEKSKGAEIIEEHF